MLLPSLLPTACIPTLPKPSFPISHQPPQESTGPDVSDPVGQATVSAPPAATSASGGRHTSQHATPQNSTGGHQASLPMLG